MKKFSVYRKRDNKLIATLLASSETQAIERATGVIGVNGYYAKKS